MHCIVGLLVTDNQAQGEPRDTRALDGYPSPTCSTATHKARAQESLSIAATMQYFALYLRMDTTKKKNGHGKTCCMRQRGSTGDRTRIARFKVQSANHYTIEPRIYMYSKYIHPNVEATFTSPWKIHFSIFLHRLAQRECPHTPRYPRNCMISRPPVQPVVEYYFNSWAFYTPAIRCSPITILQMHKN